MGKFRKGKSKANSTKRPGKEDDSKPARVDTTGIRGSWEDIQTENPVFERYYKAQKIISEEDWPVFMAKLKVALPTTFRFTGSRSTAQDLNDHLISHYVPDLNDVSLDGVKQPPPSQLSWYPNGFGWQINVGKHVIRKSPEYKKLQQFLVYETEVGNLSRQEAVSMIPPLLLDVQPHHLVLDMCAAPGSKTAQLLEALHASSSSATNAKAPTGLVVANDSDLKRAQLLVHQSSRLPSANVLVTNLDASRFPKISLGPQGLEKYGQKNLQFDRILCDVPCSGDGTMRKNAQIWNKWMVGDGNGLHSLQLRILLRGMDLLKPGGRLVYSTCSFNPAENESVVAAALRKNTAFRIIDASSSLPNLIRAPGLTTWKAGVGKDCLIYDTYEDFCAAEETTDEMRERNHETMWPKGDEVELGLEKCLRLYPHLQDTGGFFVTVLEKALEEVPSSSLVDEKDQVVAPEPTATAVVDSIASTEPGSPGAPAGEPIESTTPATSSLAGSKRVASPSLDASPSTAAPASKKARSDVASASASASTPTAAPTPKVIIGANMNEIKPNGKPDSSFKEKPYVFMDAGEGELNTAIEHFGLKSTFSPGNLYVRNDKGEPLRSVYYTSDLIKSIITSNEYTRLRLVSAGVKLFNHQDSPGDQVKCKWRACAEGLEILLPFVGEGKILKASLKDLKVLMESHYPMIDRFVDPTKALLTSIECGSYIVDIEAGEYEDAVLKQNLIVPVWRAKNSMSLMIAKAEKLALSSRVWGRNIVADPPKTQHGVTFAAAAAAKVAEEEEETAANKTVVEGEEVVAA